MEHFIVWFICIVIPFISFFTLRRIKRQPSESLKVRSYLFIYVAYALILMFSLNSRPLEELLWTDEQFSPWFWIPAGAIVVYNLLNIVIAPFGLYHSEKFREAVHKVYAEKAFIFPTNQRQIIMFCGVAVIVGIVEEVFYRSYLFGYIQDVFGFSALLNGLLLTFIFGLGHFPQGGIGVLSSIVNGLMYWMLFMLTGSLLLPILLHILYDARIALTSYIVLRQKESPLA